MPGYRVEAADPTKPPRLELYFVSKEDLISFVNSILIPIGKQFGVTVEVKELEKVEALATTKMEIGRV